MKKNYALLALFLVAALATTTFRQANSEIPSPPVGSAGDPFNANKTCAQSGCHPSPSNTNTSDLSLFITEGTSLDTLLTSSFEYVPGATYNMNFQLASTTGRYGFQISSFAGTSTTQAGSFAVTDATHTALKTASGRQYMGHKNASTFKNWEFKWTAPASGDVTFYYAYNNADNDGESTNDVIYNGSVTISPKTSTGIKDIATKVSDLSIFPNPVSKNFGLSFNLKSNDEVTAQLYSLTGELMSTLISEEQMSAGTYNRNFDINNLAEGVYTLKLTVGGISTSKKIVKL